VSRRGLATVLLALVVAGCGGGSPSGEKADAGTARLWVTSDRGAHVILTATVPAETSVMQALRARADVATRYGGRYVQAIGGLAGSLSGRRDWFYFVNGIEPDVGAVEVTLHAGDVAWWDYRSWEGRAEAQPVVVGAFPEPFRHGWDGRTRPVEVQAPAPLAGEAAALRRLLRPVGEPVGAANVFVLAVRDGTTGATLTAERGTANDAPVTFRLRGSLAAVRAAARALVAHPAIVARHYVARFDEQGRVVG
jgi:hypothetical protein